MSFVGGKNTSEEILGPLGKPAKFGVLTPGAELTSLDTFLLLANEFVQNLPGIGQHAVEDMRELSEPER